MIVRALRLLSLLLPAVAVFAPIAAAFTSGVWQGDANYDEAGGFTDCTMTAQSEDGVLLGFVISRDFDWGLVIADERWSLDVGRTQEVALIVDDGATIPAIAKVVDVHGILIPLANTDPVVDAMRHGEVMSIITQGAKISFKLTGTADAIADLAACVDKHVDSESL